MHTMKDVLLNGLFSFLEDVEEFVFLDTSRPDNENCESLLFLQPEERLICKIGDDLKAYLEALQDRIAQGYYLAGYASYELGAFLEDEIDFGSWPDRESKQVIADFGVFEKPLRFDHHTGENNFPGDFTENCLLGDYTINNLRPNMTESEYLKALEKVQAYIGAGDTYQVNYTLKLLFEFSGCAERLYRDLRRNQSVAYGAYIKWEEERILSFSPELFFRKNGAQISVRPMKGTACRGRNGDEEQKNSDYLHSDIKNRSENVMIVDLLRNDLARLMHGYGQSKVWVDSLFDVESYESLLQMTSTVKAEAPDVAAREIKLVDLFKALFPCGSITGAPKIRTMQIIDELEKEQRGVYTGAIGYLGPDGSAVFNVPIRTVCLAGGLGEMGIGAGITYDSDPVEEWHESLLKGKFLTHAQPDFMLFETMLWQPGKGYWLLDAHLKRLESGARFFKFSFDRNNIDERLTDEERTFGNGHQRVRLSLSKDGRITLATVPCDPPAVSALQHISDDRSTELPLIDFSKERVETDSPWRFHKTTRRKVFNKEYAKAQEQGLFDLLFCNENGQITEGCISNLIIYYQGEYLTPPVECGLLPGVMRETLLSDNSVAITEKVITKTMVMEAEAIFVCNSVRGVVQVRLKGGLNELVHH